MSGHFSFSLCEDFLGKISKPPTNKDLASMTVPFSEFMIDHRSYAHNLSCCERDSNPWPLRYRFSALPTELSSQLGAGHIVSSYFVFQVSHLACSTCCCEKWREGLLWTTNFNFAARSSNSQLVNIFSDKWRICVSREAVSRLTTWSLPCCDKANLENNRNYHWLQCNYL